MNNSFSQQTAAVLLRLSLAAGFLSAVASRLSLWGHHSSGWNNFLTYTGEVNSFAPKKCGPAIAIASTILETLFGLLLLFGFKTRMAAYGAAVLTFLFALAMAWSYGVKEPLDYSVFAFSSGALLLATMPAYTFSIDHLLSK